MTLTLSRDAATMFGLTGTQVSSLDEFAAATGPAGGVISREIEKFFRTGEPFSMTIQIEEPRALEVSGEARGFSAIVTLSDKRRRN